MEYGHSEGTFTLKTFLVYLVKVPSELQNSQRGSRESRFVVLVDFTYKKDTNDGIWPFWGHFYTKKDFSLFSKSALRIAKFSTWRPWEPFCRWRTFGHGGRRRVGQIQKFFFRPSAGTKMPRKTCVLGHVVPSISPYCTRIQARILTHHANVGQAIGYCIAWCKIKEIQGAFPSMYWWMISSQV